jgi:hypothetical protein
MSPSPPASVTRLLAGVVLAGLAALVGAAGWHAREAVPAPAVVRPGAAAAVRDRCIDCHSEIVESFRSAPHHRTLHRASEPENVAKFAGRSFTRPETGVAYHYTVEEGRLWLSTPAYGRKLPIDWIFGSGSHAQTPLITLPDRDGRTSAIEHAVSWYPSGKLDATMGREKSLETSGLGAVGRAWGPAETANCFGCHCSEVPLTDGRLDETKIQLNLDCARCHRNTPAHVREIDAGTVTTNERLGALAPLEAVERCGECHRRAEDFEGAIFPENPALARFAPVGLIQSPCFLRQSSVQLVDGSSARLDCTTCHDPHVGSIKPNMVIVGCQNCHSGSTRGAVNCSASRTDSNCLPCHMPKVPLNSELSFTDHWIRVHPIK